MSLFRLILREITFRKLGFTLAVFAVLCAAAVLVMQVLLLAQHDLRTEQLLAAKEQATRDAMEAKKRETAKVMAQLEDDIRKDMKNLGFNLRILPKDVNLREMLAKDYADKYMPEDYADRLARSKIVTINHLSPMLQQRIDWPEQKAAAINLVGTRGELPLAFQDKKKPIQQAVPKGKIVLGHHLRYDFKPGDTVVVHGRKFTVQQIHDQRGDVDDITIWLHLQDAQELLGKPGLINGMLALGCNCTADRLSVIREEIMGILPDTQVEEFVTRATVRAEARTRVAKLHQQEVEAMRKFGEAEIAREKQGRQALRDEKEALAAVLVPLVLLAACLWVGLLALANVRERRGEIGLYRALGMGSTQLLALFLGRAALVGLLGAALGVAAGAGLSYLVGDHELAGDTFQAQAWLALAVLLAAPLASALAAWVPAVLAVRQDPAVVLQQES